jgi:ABC-type lipoprotein export system ATPase subunit
MKQKAKQLPAVIDIRALEARLPAKKKRSHHEVVKVSRVSKEFKVGTGKVAVLSHINLILYSGEFVIIYGPSGCGKSTFLHTILGLEAPTRGSVLLRGTDVYKMGSDERTSFRREKIGMVFQQANWIKSLNVWENIAYPLYLSGLDGKRAKTRSLEVLREVGMGDYADQSPNELSGGQQQRVALARALSTDPWILVADEPTGNLDSRSSEEIIELLAVLNREKRRMIVMVTHEMNFLPIATRRIGMRDGEIVSDEHD